MAGTDRFQIARHNTIMEIIHGHLNMELIEQDQYYFGGGTLCSMMFGEYRESVDIDFLSCDRFGSADLKLNCQRITTLPMWRDRPPKADKDGVRMWCEYKGECFKIEFVFESRIAFTPPERFHDVLSLSSESLLACKLLANADRGYSTLSARKDIVDILAIYNKRPDVLKSAWSTAYDAYSTWLRSCTKKALSPEEFDETLRTVGVRKDLCGEFRALLDSFTQAMEPLLNV